MPSPAGCELKLRTVDLSEHQTGVRAGNPVVVAAENLVGVDHSQTGLRADVALDPKKVVNRVFCSAVGAGPFVYRRQQGQIGTERLAGELGGENRLHDATSINQVVGSGELLDAV